MYPNGLVWKRSIPLSGLRHYGVSYADKVLLPLWWSVGERMFACRGGKTVEVLCSCTAVIQWSGAISTPVKLRCNGNPLEVLASDFMMASAKAFSLR